jgi:predicted outer membrane repeat protein
VRINVTISGNNASDSGGGACTYDSGSAPVFVNVLISGNTANQGGGMANVSYSSPKLINVTIAGNYAGYSGGGIFSDNSSYSIQNSVIWGNGSNNMSVNYGTATIANSIVQGSTDASNGNVLDAAVTEPFFVDAISPSTTPTTGGDYRLGSGAAAIIDAGDSAQYNSVFTSLSLPFVSTDLAENTRIQGAAIDMGAYERQ